LKPTMRILIVEDEFVILRHLERTFSAPPSVLIAKYGEINFIVETARNATDAKKKLFAAIETGQPFDAVLFDLGLPLVDDQEDKEHGLAILRELKSRKVKDANAIAAHVIVVASGNRQEEVLKELIKDTQIDDFVGKPWDEANEIPFRRIIDAITVHRVRMKSEWEKKKNERFGMWWIGAIQKSALYTHAELVTTGVSLAEIHLRELRQRIEEYCPVSFRDDTGHPVVNQLSKLQHAIAGIAIELTRSSIEGGIDANQQNSDEQSFSSEIKRIFQTVRCGCIAKNLRVEIQGNLGISIQTPITPVGIMLEEILIGIIEASEDGTTIPIEIVENSGNVEVVFKDSNSDLNFIDSPQFQGGPSKVEVGGRAWRLGLVKHIAWGIGADLSMKVGCDGIGSVITLRLPKVRQ
jgi:CheY-like chemotaxis protein